MLRLSSNGILEVEVEALGLAGVGTGLRPANAWLGGIHQLLHIGICISMVYTYIYIYIYIHTYVYTHMYACLLLLPPRLCTHLDDGSLDDFEGLVELDVVHGCVAAYADVGGKR